MRATLVLAGLIVAGLLAQVQPAAAYTNAPTTGSSHNQTFFVYTNPGEFLSVAMRQDPTRPSTDPATADRVPVTITSPAGVVTNCTISMSTPANGCNQSDLSSGTAGVWAIKIGFTQRADGTNATGTYQIPWILWSINVTATSTADWDFGPNTISSTENNFGGYVGEVQTALNTLINAGLTQNEQFDAPTEAAVRDFQALAGIPVNGVVDNVTKTALNNYPHPEITGRLWTERYIIQQTSNSNRIDQSGAALSFWAVSDSGVQYKADYANYNGYSSSFAVNNLGIVTAADCQPQYRSINYIENTATPGLRSSAGVVTSCANKQTNYRLFFQAPDQALPETSSAWGDSRTAASQWVVPQYRTAVLSNLKYTRSSATSAAGKIEFDLANQNGTTQLQIDVNNNGVFTDAVDRSIKTPVLKGHVSLNWDGIDGQGNPVSPDAKLSFRASLPTGGEIHFLSDDVEGRAGGLQIEQLTGPGTGSTKLNWDDSSFNNLCSRTPVTLQNMNTSPCVTQPAGKDIVAKSGGDTFDEQQATALSSTGGVHFWNGSNADNSVTAANAATFGDNRAIDEWAFVQDNANTLLLEWTPPLAQDDSASTKEKEPVTINILSNDSGGSQLSNGGATVQHPLDPATVKLQAPAGVSGTTLSADGKTLTVPGQGVYQVNPTTGVVTFTPQDGFTGAAAAIPYTVQDDEGNPTSALIRVTVTAVTRPSVVDDTDTTPQATPKTVTILSNDTAGENPIDITSVQLQVPQGSADANVSPDGKTLTIPGEGIYQVNPDGTVLFSPEAEFAGVATPVPYTVKDSKGFTATTPATITITVTADQPIQAANDTASTKQNTPVVINILENDTAGTFALDPTTVKLQVPAGITDATLSQDGKTLTIPGEGTYQVATDGKVTFTPEAAFSGNATPIGYTVNNTQGTSEASAILSIAVTASTPQGSNDTAVSVAGTPTVIDLTKNDIPSNGASIDPTTIKLEIPQGVDGATLSSDGKTLVIPGEGTYQLHDNGTVTFTAEKTFSGKTTPITYTAKDTAGKTYSATLSITVSAAPTPTTPLQLLAETGQNFWILVASLVGVVAIASVSFAIAIRRRKHSA